MRAYERMLKYIKVCTTSDSRSETVPSTYRQFDLANLLVKEMKDLGIEDAHVDDKCMYMEVYQQQKDMKIKQN